jgi:hypothetical protein
MFHWLRTISIFLVLESACAFSTSHTEVYSESAFFSPRSIFWNTLSARTFPAWEWTISPYLQLGSEQAMGSERSGYIYWAPGLNWTYNQLRVFGESRFRSETNELQSPTVIQNPHDFRILLTLGDYQDSPLVPKDNFFAFWEPYSEVLYTSRDSDNIIFRGFTRVGLRYKFTSSTYTDLFVEPTLAVDRIGHFYNNHLDIKPSLRAGHCTGELCISVSAARLFPQYLDGLIQDSQWTSEEGFRFLATIGGPI